MVAGAAKATTGRRPVVNAPFYLELIWSLVTQLKLTKRISLLDAAEPPKSRRPPDRPSGVL